MDLSVKYIVKDVQSTEIFLVFFSCEEAALEGLTDVSGSQTIVYNVMHLYVPSL